MERSLKLYLIRHTQLQVAPDICYGQSDIDVAMSFVDELAAIKNTLGNVVFDAIYSSPLQRCNKLAVALEMGESKTDYRLQELHFGDWEMQAWDEIPREIFDVWAQDYANISPPNGETFSQLQARGVSFIDDILQKHPSDSVAVVTHGGMIRALVAHVLNMPLKGLFRLSIDHGSITHLELGGVVPKIHYVNKHHSNW
jgi:alpha-ribazole phosphatase